MTVYRLHDLQVGTGRCATNILVIRSFYVLFIAAEQSRLKLRYTICFDQENPGNEALEDFFSFPR
jgi:hypothetical protein